jgi:outer membrane protein
MRSLFKLFTPLFFLLFIANANSQTAKIGHIDLGAIIEIMPERVTAEQDFEKFQTDLEEVFAEMQKNYTEKLMELEQFNEGASEVKRNAKLADLQSLQKRIQNYEATARQQTEQKYQSLLKPVFDKAIKAIEEVAAQQGLIYVFDSGSDFLQYKSGQSIDIFPLVKKQLGIN